MDDLIRRQAAINTIDFMYKACEGSLDDFRDLLIEGFINLPPVQPEIIYCKDCVKHNRNIGDFEEREDGRHWFWKDEACPLERWRGKAQGHEFDYQFCVYAERRTDETD